MSIQADTVPPSADPVQRRDPNSRITQHDDFHRLVLGGSIAIVILAIILNVRDDQRVGLGFLPDWPLPELCMSRVLLGRDCPGCGLTRSFIFLAHGDVTASLNVHRVGWLLALAVALQIPYRLWALRSRSGLPLGSRAPNIAAICIVIVLFANWIAGLIVRIS